MRHSDGRGRLAWPEFCDLFAAGEEDVGGCVEFLEAHVVVRLRRVPIEIFGNGAAWDAEADDIGAIGRLLRVDGDEIIHGGIGGDNDCIGANGAAVAEGDMGIFAAGDFGGVGIVMDLTAAFPDRGGDAVEVFQRVELGLVRIAEAAAGVEIGKRRAVDEVAIGLADAFGGVELGLEEIHAFAAGGDEEVGMGAEEIAIDVFVTGDLLDRFDGGFVGIGGEFQAGGAVEFFDFDQAVSSL